jgi:hypothetical protein
MGESWHVIRILIFEFFVQYLAGLRKEKVLAKSSEDALSIYTNSRAVSQPPPAVPDAAADMVAIQDITESGGSDDSDPAPIGWEPPDADKAIPKADSKKKPKKPKKKAKKQIEVPSENIDDSDAAEPPPPPKPKVPKGAKMPPEQAKLIKKATVSLELFEKIERDWHVVGSKLPKECSFLVTQQSQPGLGRIPIIPEICFRLWGPNGRCCQEAH